jgi:filamentous hemagglutinin
LIDTGNVQTVGTRILVKDQANAVQNGIYTWANSTALVRSTDADQYGANSVQEISINDYFFTTNGNVNAGTAFIVDAPAGTITFGTSNIGFAIFSQSPVYSANTAAGLSLTGTVFSAKTDGITTAFDGGGNIIVKASANLTTPNIGAATGTSLNLTGNIDPGNVNTGGLVTATGNVTGGNILTGGLVSAAANVTANNGMFTNIVNTASFTGSVASLSGNVTGGNVLTGGLVSATANVTGGNILTGGLISAASTITGTTLIGSVVTASGNVTGGNILTGGLISATSTITSAANITGGNLLTGGLVSATANVTGGNLLTGGLISATSTITSAANITGGNILTGGLVSATANVTGGNILTAGLVSATGNVTGNYILGNGAFLSGVITSVANINNGTSNVSIYAANANVAVSVDGTANVAVFATTGEYITGLLSVSGNVTGGNVLTGGLISSTGTITSAANITGGNLLTGGLASVTGNITGGNVLTGGLISSTGNINGGNLTTVGLISTSGNIAGGNILSNNYFYANGQAIVFGVNYTAATTPPSSPANGWQWYNTTTDVLYEYLSDSVSQYWVDVSSPAFAAGVVANISISGSMLVNANATYDIGSSSQTFANVYAQNYYGNGASLSGIITSVSNINNGTTNMTVVSSGGNITTNVAGTANVGVWYNGGLSITGDLSVSGNATLSGNILGDRIQNGTTQIDIQTPGGNANVTIGGTSNVAVFATDRLTLAGNLLPSANITYDLGTTTQRWKDLWLSNSTIYLGNAQISANATSLVFTNPAGGTTVLAGASAGVTGATVSATGNITGGNLTTAGILTVNSGAAATAIVNGAGNAVGNIGSSSVYFNRLFAQATTALYADLAENYLGDADYAPGTVVDFGGTQEVTISTVDSSKRVAGVVSTNPAHLMNAGIVGEHVVTVALIGRVPASVTGTVRKGDLMVSAGDGTARAVTIASPKVGTIIGKALEDFNGDKGTIEIVIGKH